MITFKTCVIDYFMLNIFMSVSFYSVFLYLSWIRVGGKLYGCKQIRVNTCVSLSCFYVKIFLKQRRQPTPLTPYDPYCNLCTWNPPSLDSSGSGVVPVSCNPYDRRNMLGLMGATIHSPKSNRPLLYVCPL